MSRTIKTIPATISRYTSAPINEPLKRKVAAYARVSTDFAEQLTSYEAQVDYYTQYIKSRSDWEFVKVYTDEGITGTSTKKREGFKTMISDALSGKIDLIITKSVSRFARNTVDSLVTIRKLKENNIECYFEKENIYTFDSRGELLLTIMSGIAQEEARSISENTTWGQRKRFADGKVSVSYSRFLGYEKGEDGTLKINETEAKTVRRIFGLYLQGYTFYGIAQLLTQERIPTPANKQIWRESTIRSILTNEKYKGDALLQKSYTVDFLTKKTKKNNGEIRQYYVHDNHQPIIIPELFDRVQQFIVAKRRGKHFTKLSNIFSGCVKCGQCGGWFGSKLWHSNEPKYRKQVWCCNKKYEGNKKCESPSLTPGELEAAFIRGVNIFFNRDSELSENIRLIENALSDTSIPKLQPVLTEFDAEFFRSTVEFMTVYSKDDIRITFRNGLEIPTA